MTQTVTMPDGSIHNFPDEATADMMSSALGLAPEPSPNLENEQGVAANFAAGKISGPSAALQTMGNEAGAAWDAAGNLVKKIPGYDYAKDAADAVSGAAKSGAQSVADYLDTKPQFRALGNAGMEAENTVSDIAKAHPEAAGDAEAILKILPVESVLGMAGDVAKSGLNAASSDVAYNTALRTARKTGVLPSTQAMLDDSGISADQIAAMTPQQISKVKSGMYASGIVQNIQDARATKNGIYSMADEVGNDHTFNAADTRAQLDALHSKYSSDPAYDGTPLVRKLDSWRDMFNDDGTITPTRLNKLKDQVDDAFRENPKSPEGEVYGAIQQPVNSAVNTAKEEFPNWGTLINTADDAHYNIMKSTQDDTAFTGKWSPKSQKDFQINMGKDNNPGDLMGDTINQISSLSAVKNEAELQKMMAFVPKELQGQFLTDIAKNSAVPSGVKKIVKAALYASRGNYGWSLSNIMDSLPTKAAIEGWDPDAATHITDRMEQWKQAANEAYENHLDEKLARQGMNAGTRYSASTAQKMLPYTTQALPAPERPMVSDWAGNTRPQTPEEYNSGVQSRQAWPSVAPGEAQPAAAYGDTREPMTGSGQWQRDFMRENKSRPLATTEGQEYKSPERKAAEDTLKNLSGPEYDDFLKKNGYAKGGAIPSEAQIAAGNYPKQHIKFQGLDISIETKKGEIRRGKGWENISPADYGYIRGTTAADKEHVDCYIGPHEKSNRVYIIDQHHLHNKAYDEAKCMLGFASRDEAVSTYKAGFSDGKGHQRIGKVTRMSMAEFKDWLKNGNTKKPVKEAA